MKKHVLLVVLMLLPLMASAQVKRTINVETAGTLPTLISEEEKYTIEELTLTGNLNGTDFRILRDMVGNNYQGKLTEGKLKVLDISNANVLKGGDLVLETNRIEYENGAFSYGNTIKRVEITKDNVLPSDIFKCCKIESIVFPTSLTEIETDAFADCHQLTTIGISKGITTIGWNAFYECTNLSFITVAEGNEKYDSRDNCNAIIETASNTLIKGCNGTVIPSTVTRIESSAFCYCSHLGDIFVPKSVTSIARGAFYHYCGVTSVTVEAGNPVYDSRQNCNAIVETSTNTLYCGFECSSIPSDVTIIGDYAFSGCLGLTSIIIPDNINSIGSFAFNGCADLKYITIPNSVTEVGSYVFVNTKVEHIKIPASVTSIGTLAFASIPFIELESMVPMVISEDAFRAREREVLIVPQGCKSAYAESDYWKEFKMILEGPIPNGNINFADSRVKSICVSQWDLNHDYEISYCEAATVTSLGEAFNNNNWITSFDELQYFTSLTSIDNFGCCIRLSSIVIPKSVVSIKDGAFLCCRSLKSLEIPKTVSSIGNSAFTDCNNLVSIIVEEGNPVYDSRDNCNAIIETLTDKLILGCKTTNIPNSIKTIGSSSFYCNAELSSVFIPKSVETIEVGAFYGNSGLTSIIVEDGNTYYDSREGCNAIIETSSNHLILGCKNTEFPKDVASIETGAFSCCTGLTTLSLPNSILSIGNNAFWGCSELTEIVLPDNLQSLGSSVFQYCEKLRSVTIPGSVKEIGINMFDACSQLNTIKCFIASPFDISESIFNDNHYDNTTLFVPDGSKELYQQTKGWSRFKKIVEMVDPNEFSLSFMGQTINDGATLLIDAEGWSALGNIYTDPDGNTKNGLFVFVNKGGKVSGNYSLEILSNTLNGDLKWSMGGETYALNEVTKLEKSFSTDDNGIASVKFSAENIPNEGSLDAKLIVTIGEKTKTFYIKINFKKKDSPDLTVSGKVGEPVDLGLSVKWASWNVGAGAPEEYGNHYAWGELEPKTDYSASTYEFYNNGYTKYGSIDNKYELDEADDVARQKWGEDWRMPTFDELKELYEKCSFSNETYNGVPVTKVTGPNGNYIYMPGPGNFTGQTLYFKNSVGSYWSRNLETDSYAKDLDFFTGYRSLNGDTRYHGQSVRPVYVGGLSKRIVHVAEAGSLPTLISEAEKYLIEDLTLTGELNGTDFRLLRDMAGNNYKGEVTEGKLKVLDLSGASIVEGGDSYLDAKSISYSYKRGNGTMFTGSVGVYYTSKDMLSCYIFAGCCALQSIKLPAEVSTIEETAFASCKYLTSVVIPDKVTTIKGRPFDQCDALSSIIVESGNTVFDSRDNCNAIIETSTNTLISGCKGTIIPNSVTSIGDMAFGNCKFIEINLPNSITYIGERAFSYCEDLESLSLPKNVTFIGESAFSGCWSLTSISVDSENAKYDSRDNCNAIIETATNTLVAGCTNTVIPESVTTIGKHGMEQRGITTFTISGNVETIEEYGFQNCYRLVSLVISEGVKTIGRMGFASCVLQNLILPSTIEYIGSGAFVSNKFSSVTIYAEDVPQTEVDVFKYSNLDNATLFVPYGTKSKYEQADGWKEFKNIVEMGETTPIIISSAKQVTYMSDKNLDFTGYPDLKAYVATGYDKSSGTIWLTRVKEVPANTGFLLMGEANTYEIPAKSGESTSYYMNLFKGTIEGTTIYTTDGDYTNYYLSNGDAGVGFYKVTKTEGVALAANRAYLSVPTEIPTVGSEGSTETIKVSSAGQVPYYNTESLDFSSLDAQGVKAYTATGYDYNSGTIWLTRVKQVPAKTGILIMAPEGEYPVPTASVSSVYANMFRGTLEGTTIQTHEEIDGKDYINYYLSSGASGVGFYRVTKEEGVTIGTNRCYLPILNKDAAAGTRSVNSDLNQIAIEEADEVIGIQLMRGIGDENGETTNLTPALSKGEGDGEWYTLQGQRVAKPGKGLYIRNGKVVVIK